MKRFIVLSVFLAFIASAQDATPPPKSSDAKSATPAAPGKSRVDEVIEAVRAHVPDKEIIASLRKDKKPIDLSLGDKTKLKSAGVSDSVIEAMQEPSGSATTPAGLGHAAEPASVDGPMPKADDSGPNLEATMKFIQDKLNGRGKVSRQAIWQVTVAQDPTLPEPITTSSQTTYQTSDELSDALADVSACTLSARKIQSSSKESGQAFSVMRSTDKFSFRDVDRLVVELEDGTELSEPPTVDDNKNTIALAVKYAPPFFKLRVVMNSGKTVHSSSRFTDENGKTTVGETDLKEDQFYFQAEEAAQRMAKAMVRAVELCGGGNKDPF